MPDPDPAPRITPDVPAGVCAVIVTYADRAALCLRVIEGALVAGAEHVMVVDNGSAAPSRVELTSLAARDPRVTVYTHPRNTGSAVGFGSGQAAATRRPESAWIWLLDDDNLPASDSLSALFAARERLLDQHPGAAIAVLSLRPDRSEQHALLKGAHWRDVFPSPAAFLSFDLSRRLRRVVRSRAAPDAANVAKHAPLEVPYGPYGGLLIARGDLAGQEPPDARFFLYEDDTEFTYRLHRSGLRLFLVPSSTLSDLEASWYNEAPGRSAWTRLLLAPSDRRVYYSVRNRIYFEERDWSRGPLRRSLNRMIFLTGLGVAARLLRRPERLALIRRAIREGHTGALGETL